jgi:protein phosphatase
MGGHANGAFASRLAVQTMAAYFDSHGRSASPTSVLEQAILRANEAVMQKAAESIELKGMGTTLVAATVNEKHVTYANVGDSRGYLIHDREIFQMTRDHSLVAEQVREGLLAVEDMDSAPRRNVITRSIGQRSDIKVDLFETPWQAGDSILLCTDGLWGTLSDGQILSVMLEMPPQAAATRLIELTLTSQAPDNVSAVIVKRLR